MFKLQNLTLNFNYAVAKKIFTWLLVFNYYCVRINYTARSGFYLGVMETGCLYAGAKGLSVTILETKDLATTYEIKWT